MRDILFIFMGMVLLGVGVYLIRWKVSIKLLMTHNEAIENYIVIVVALYGIFMAFVIMDVWNERKDTESNMVSESNETASFFRLARNFPDPQRTRLLTGVRDYLTSVTEEEWDLMVKGEIKSLAYDYPVLDRIWDALMEIEPKTSKQEILMSQAMQSFEDIVSARRTRFLDSEKQLTAYIWIILIVGGACTLICTYFIGMENIRSHLILTVMTGGFVILMLFAVRDLQNPFRGAWSLSKEPYVQVLQRVNFVLKENP